MLKIFWKIYWYRILELKEKFRHEKVILIFVNRTFFLLIFCVSSALSPTGRISEGEIKKLEKANIQFNIYESSKTSFLNKVLNHWKHSQQHVFENLISDHKDSLITSAGIKIKVILVADALWIFLWFKWILFRTWGFFSHLIKNNKNKNKVIPWIYFLRGIWWTLSLIVLNRKLNTPEGK